MLSAMTVIAAEPEEGSDLLQLIIASERNAVPRMRWLGIGAMTASAAFAPVREREAKTG